VAILLPHSIITFPKGFTTTTEIGLDNTQLTTVMMVFIVERGQ
jgi:hypothetical protein